MSLLFGKRHLCPLETAEMHDSRCTGRTRGKNDPLILIGIVINSII